MLGINAQTGKPLSGIDHLRQSISDILTTRVGTRVMRRDYGSQLPELADNPMTPESWSMPLRAPSPASYW
ncbi:MAG: GPW/gp25 family protein [Gammaproteobacteria bacterium]|nr:GPW/gp25 family protein [Gammaproteobacteria bacterium]